MKWKICLLFFLCVFLLLMTGCGEKTTKADTLSTETPQTSKTESYSEMNYCEICGQRSSKTVEVEGSNGYFCYDCVVECGFSKCKSCGLYYESGCNDCSASYCHYCYEDYAKPCFICWEDYGEQVRIVVDGEDYYLCPPCVSDYFEEVEPIKPFYRCIECNKLFTGEHYEHYIYRGVDICGDCVIEKGYEECGICHKYTDEGLTDGVCGYCIEKGLSMEAPAQ